MSLNDLWSPTLNCQPLCLTKKRYICDICCWTLSHLWCSSCIRLRDESYLPIFCPVFDGRSPICWLGYFFQAGKRLILITNSDYHYTNKMMQFAFNQYLPEGMDWRDLFDMVCSES